METEDAGRIGGDEANPIGGGEVQGLQEGEAVFDAGCAAGNAGKVVAPLCFLGAVEAQWSVATTSK